MLLRIPDQAVPQVDLALLVGIGGTRRLQSAVDLGANQCRVLKQADDFVPYDLDSRRVSLKHPEHRIFRRALRDPIPAIRAGLH